jgi:N-acetylmuramoyl-L-alanine amidase
MRFSVKAVATAAFSLVALGTFATVPGSSALVASDIPQQRDAALLPQSVIDEAIKEEASIPTTIYLPENPVRAKVAKKVAKDVLDPEARASEPRAGSLAELVARRSSASIEGRDAECLAGAVYFESKGELLAGQLAVAEVIINRSRSGRFPSTLCGVVFDKNQFSFVRGGRFPPIVRSSENWRTAVAISKIAMNKEWSSGVGKALFFHARYVSPGWRLTRVAALGNHIFYR